MHTVTAQAPAALRFSPPWQAATEPPIRSNCMPRRTTP
ncbi:MAG: hypothetical protein GAK34_03373 [Delftia tsuruhatensis]|nr:MAG: hypothetical protein GAK34_03373 [Delftia tsuruhatensis]